MSRPSPGQGTAGAGPRALRALRAAPLRAVVLSAGVVFALVAACTTPKVKEEKLCTAGQYVFCRCADRQEGAKLCNDDAKSFGPCEPCQSFDNPEGPLQPGDPRPNRPFDPDAGKEARCGDGVVDEGEDCDDGNDSDADGCDTRCKLSGLTPPASNGCPGLLVHVWGDDHEPTLSSKTPGAGNRSVKPSCGSRSGSTAPDRVFQVVVHRTGKLKVVVDEASFNVLLYVSNECDVSENTSLACANAVDAVGGEALEVPVESGNRYWVFVDGAGTTAPDGDFRVTFAVE